MRRAATFFMVLVFITTAVHAQPPARYEVGVIIGQPTGLSGKYWVSRRVAFDAAAAWSFTDESFEFHASYLFHPYFFDVDQGELPLYFGAGAVTYLRDDFAVGARFPVGISFIFDDIPLSLFLEIAPIVEVIPETGFNVNGGVGVRLAF